MGKPSRERSLADNEAKAIAKNIRISPQKLNLVAELIRGKKVNEAMADLEFSRKRVAQDVRKCVMSAVANAENNHGLDVDELVVAEAWVGKNIVMKRFARPRPWPRLPGVEAVLADHGRRPSEGRRGRAGEDQEDQAGCQSGGSAQEGGRVMGQKVNPVGLRVGINRTWDSRWFAARGEYGKLLHEDMAMREHIMQHQRTAGISKVVIERPHKKCRVTVHSARPGVLIGKKGADIEKLRGELARLTTSEVHLNIVEVRKPEIDATLVAESIAQQLERRVAFRRAMKRVGSVGASPRRRRHPYQRRRPSRRRGNRAHRMVPRRPRAAAHAARRHRLRLRPCQDRLRRHRHQGLDLQGRDHRARSHGLRAPFARDPGSGRSPSAPRRWRSP